MKNTFLVVRHFSDRKKPCLVIEQGNTVMPIATFRNEASAELFKHFIGEENECLYRALEDDILDLYDEFKESEVDNGNDD